MTDGPLSGWTDWGDVDNDGDLDLLLMGVGQSSSSTPLSIAAVMRSGPLWLSASQ